MCHVLCICIYKHRKRVLGSMQNYTNLYNSTYSRPFLGEVGISPRRVLRQRVGRPILL